MKQHLNKPHSDGRISASICAIGGCHISGFPVGDELSFISYAFPNGGAHIKHFIGKPVSSKNAISQIEGVPAAENEFWIVQLGNFETGRSITSRAGTKSKASATLTETMNTNATTPPGAHKIWLQALIKVPILFFRDLVGKPVFDPKKFDSEVGAALQIIKKRNPRRIFVLSTFYSLQPHTNIYRRRANSILKNVSLKLSCEFIDIYSELLNTKTSSGYGGMSKYFYDEGHLSVLGHQLAAQCLQKHLDKNMQNE